MLARVLRTEVRVTLTFDQYASHRLEFPKIEGIHSLREVMCDEK